MDRGLPLRGALCFLPAPPVDMPLTPFPPLQNSVSGTQSSSDTDSLHTIDEDDEAEPEIIYATAPLGSRWAPPSATLSKTPARHLRASSRTSSMSSLSSISEESTASA